MGNTRPLIRRKTNKAVHPHACGEHVERGKLRERAGGSSPRMWGTLYLGNKICGVIRFIPTHVGNTRSSSIIYAKMTVHPHACGEHRSIWAISCKIPGSSPRMWGTHGHDVVDTCDIRFIPTHVGNTIANNLARGCASVHPHACGEHGQCHKKPIL